MSRKPKRTKPIKEKILYISTLFFTSPESEEALSISCKNVLDAILTSKNFPALNKIAEAGLVIWKEYDDLLRKSLTLDASNRVTDDKMAARFKLCYLIQRLVWLVQAEGNNNEAKMTADTGLQLVGARSQSKPITTAPAKVKYEKSVPDNPNTGTVALPIVFAKTGAPGGVRGSSYRYKMTGAAAYTEPTNFDDNRKRLIPGLRLGDQGVFQVRYNGGTKGVGPWSEEFPFVVA